MLEDPRVIRVLRLLAPDLRRRPCSANGSCRRPPHPSSETSRTIPSAGESGGEILLRADGVPASATRWSIQGITWPARRTPDSCGDTNQIPPSSRIRPSLGLPPHNRTSQAAPASLERHCRERRGPSACGGLGNQGAIRARFFARSVNTEGPRPQAADQGRRGRPGGRGEGAASSPGALDFVAEARIAWSGIGERDSGVGGVPCVCQPR